MNLSIDVVIPVKNGASTLRACLQSIKNQSLQPQRILILDSASEDQSREIARDFGAEIVPILAHEFNHGLTRNRGVKESKADLIFFTVQDAQLADPHVLEGMHAYFQSHEDVMALAGHQAVPQAQNTNPAQWFRRYSEPKPVFRKLPKGQQMSSWPMPKQREWVAWDNVVAMYKREALLQQPFVATQFAEDWVWSYQALKRGWTLLYAPEFVVYHYHHRDFEYAKKSGFTLRYHLYKCLGIDATPIRPIPKFWQGLKRIIRAKGLGLRSRCYWVMHHAAGVWGDYRAQQLFEKERQKANPDSMDRLYEKICKGIPLGRPKL